MELSEQTIAQLPESKQIFSIVTTEEIERLKIVSKSHLYRFEVSFWGWVMNLIQSRIKKINEKLEHQE